MLKPALVLKSGYFKHFKNVARLRTYRIERPFLFTCQIANFVKESGVLDAVYGI